MAFKDRIKIRKLLGRRIRDRRAELDLSCAELGERIELTKEAVSSYERGDRSPRAEGMPGLAKALETTVGWLYGETTP